MKPYFPSTGNKDTSVAVELFSSTQSIPLHTHEFEELVLVIRGTCSHQLFEKSTPLLPGDVFLVPSHRPHSYQIFNSLTVYNVQFYPEKLESRLGKLWAALKPNKTVPELSPVRQYNTLKIISATEQEDNDGTYISEQEMNHFGVLRLDMKEAAYVITLLERMHFEQQNRIADYERIMHAYLEVLLVMFMRVKARQLNRDVGMISATASSMIMDALAFIESHYAEPISFDQIAAGSYLSPNYFRTMFKKVTGFSPMDYLNRLRIIKSMRYLQMENKSIARVAEMVGIPDPNYYSRLFKRTIGYSPRHFKG